jgi:predicted CXXCH cytochrome family protein
LKNDSHVKRVFALLIITVLIGFAVRKILLPATFGSIGHYRAASLKDILNQNPVYQSKAACSPCHEDNYKLHEKDVHYGVQCENCHGPGNSHIAEIVTFLNQNHVEPTSSGQYSREALKAVPKKLVQMPKEYTLEGCLFCHRKLDSRPHDFAQIDPKEHFKTLHVTDTSIRCVECHNPHEPLYLLDPVADARIHPTIYECEDCHKKRPEKNVKDVADHPVIFECENCHTAIVQDFKKREHAFMRCTECHLYHPENDTSGRIYKNSNKQFCLLCHEKKPFKDPKRLPQIEASKHLEKMPGIMSKDAHFIQNSKTACLECHYNFIHDSNLIKTLREQKQWAKKVL